MNKSYFKITAFYRMNYTTIHKTKLTKHIHPIKFLIYESYQLMLFELFIGISSIGSVKKKKSLTLDEAIHLAWEKSNGL
jgi:hypothetical protein